MTDLITRILGGRPMCREEFAFTDIVSGKMVYYWRDKRGRKWMAEGAWAWFRVKAYD